MTFAAPFSRVIARPFGGVPATSSAWWLSGGIAAANCIAAYQPKGAASLAASYVNLTGNTSYNLTTGDAPTFDTSYGWYFGGSDWLKTGVIPENDLTWSMIIALTEISRAAANKCAAGTYASGYANLFKIDSVGGATNTSGAGNGSYKQVATTATDLVIAVTPTGVYLNGTKTANTFTTNSQNFGQIYIGAQNELAGAGAKYIGKMQAIAIYDTNIDSYISALVTAMNAL